MKRYSAVITAILCLLLCTQVFADEPPKADGSYFTSVNVSVTLSESGQAEVTQTMALALDGTAEELRLAVPEQAKKAKVSDRSSKLTTVDGVRCLLLKSEDGFSGSQTFTLHYTMEDLVSSIDDGQLLTLPLLAAQEYPTEAMTLTVSLPQEFTAYPSFSSGYLGNLIVDSLLVSTGNTSFAATVTERLKDHETLTVTLQLEEGYFTGHFGESPFSLITTIAVFVLLALALLYWARLLRNGRLPVQARSLPPDGVNPGDVPFLLSGGDADFNMLVSHWATLGYVSFFIHRSGHVIIRRRMEMGKERRPMERKLFDLLFRDGEVCDGASMHYKRTGEAAMAAIPRYWNKRLYNRRSGAPGIPRVLCCLACAVTTMQAMDTVAPEKLHVLFLILALIAGYALCWLVQLACSAWFLSDWVKVGAGGAAALLLLILGLLGDAELFFSDPLACLYAGCQACVGRLVPGRKSRLPRSLSYVFLYESAFPERRPYAIFLQGSEARSVIDIIGGVGTVTHDIITVRSCRFCYRAHDAPFAPVAAVCRIRCYPLIGKHISFNYTELTADKAGQLLRIIEFKARLECRLHIICLNISTRFSGCMQQVYRIDSSRESDRGPVIRFKKLLYLHDPSPDISDITFSISSQLLTRIIPLPSAS